MTSEWIFTLKGVKFKMMVDADTMGQAIILLPEKYREAITDCSSTPILPAKVAALPPTYAPISTRPPIAPPIVMPLDPSDDVQF